MPFQIISHASETIPVFFVVNPLCKLFLQLHQILETLVYFGIFIHTMLVFMPEYLKGELLINNADKKKKKIIGKAAREAAI